MSFEDLQTALKFRTVMESIVREVVDRIRPRAQYGHVYSLNKSNNTAQVLLAGDVDPIIVKVYPLEIERITSVLDVIDYFAMGAPTLNSNPEFENTEAGWGDVNGNLNLSTGAPHGGSWCGVFSPSGPANPYIHTENGDIDEVVPGRWYEWTGWVKCASAAVDIRPVIDWQDAAFAATSSTEGDLVTLVANTWTEITVVGVCPQGSVNASGKVRYEEASPTDTIAVDDWHFREYLDPNSDPRNLASLVRVEGAPGNYWVSQVVANAKTPDIFGAGWDLALAEPLGANWGIGLKEDLALFWAQTFQNSIDFGWWGPFAIDPASVLRHKQVEEGTNFLSITSTTPAAGSPQCGLSFVAPPSGIVTIGVGGDIDQAQNTFVSILGWELREGSTVGSGNIVSGWGANFNNAYMIGGPVNSGAPIEGNATTLTVVTGLTSGASYNVRTMHWVNASGGGMRAYYRRLQVIPSF